MGVLGTYMDITGRKLADEALQQSEEKFRAISEQSSDLIAVTDNRGVITFASPASNELFYITPEEVCGHNFIEFAADSDVPRALELFKDTAIHGEQAKNLEFLMKRKDGSLFIGELNASPFKSGSQSGTIVNIRDITRRKHAEKALQKSEAALRALLNGINESVFLLEPDGTIAAINETTANRLGANATDMIGKVIYSFLPPDLAETRRQYIEQVVATKTPARFDDVRYGKNIDSSIYPVLDESGNVTRVAVYGLDVTERKKAESDLIKKTTELNNYFTFSIDLFCIAGTDGYFRQLNKAWEKTLGYHLNDLEGKSFFTFVHPDDLDATNQAVAALQSQKEVLAFVNRYYCKDGTYKWIEWQAYPSGDMIYAAARDITERKLAEQELIRAKETAEQNEIRLKIAQKVSNSGTWDWDGA